MMNRITAGLVAGFVALGLTAGSLRADEFIITDLEGGYLSWTNVNPSLYYTVQFRPNLMDEEDWDGSYRRLQDIRSADPIITVPVSMFWRVVGTTSPQHTRTLSAGSTVLNAGYYEATDLTTAAPSLSAENIRAGVTVFGVEGTYDHRRIIRLEGDLAFGDVEVGQDVTRDLTIHNDGSAELEVTSIDYPEGFSGAWSGTVAPAGSQAVTVTLSPTEAISYGGELTVNSPAFSGTNTHASSGIGMSIPTRIILVVNGTGGGAYAAGTAVAVTAYAAPAGQEFDAWTLDPADAELGQAFNVTTAATTVTMPEHNVTLTATYRPETVPSGMVLIPGGTNAGTNPLDEGEPYDAVWYPETYSLTVDSFYMDRYEVTKTLWDEVYEWATHPDRGAHVYDFDNAGEGKAANHPVHSVNWYDVVKWCNARSEKEGRPTVYTVNGTVYRTEQSNDVVQTSAAGYRLPTDVEWEYAARGGLQSKRFPWGDTIQHARANYHSDSSHSYDTSPTRGDHPTYNGGVSPYTSPVGSFAANGFGLYDMIGNVFEWCFDWHPSWVGSRRVLRGGDWFHSAYFGRVARRITYYPDYADYFFGFRAVLPPGQ